MVDSVNVGDRPANEKSAEELEHEAAMIKKAEDGTSSIRSTDRREDGQNVDLKSQDGEPEGDAKAERPTDIPEKFWDAEKGEVNVTALLKAQQDGEAALRKTQTGDESNKDADKNGEEDSKKGDADSKKGDADAAQENAVQVAELEFAEKGELSDATYEALSKSGLDRNTVDTYINGQRAIAEKISAAAYSPFNGEEGYTEATAWAAKELDSAQIDALDVQLTSSNPSIVAEGAKALARLYSENADITPGRRLEGGGGNAESGSYFKSSQEMQKAMADPRYSKDEAYRNDVIKKVQRADKAGVSLFG